MYIKSICPICGKESFSHIRLHRRNFEIISTEVSDTCTPEELARSVWQELAGHIYNGITTKELCRILRKDFGVLEQYCCDLVQRLKIEMDMYCPDRKHLYFVEAV